jgi:hypothetical protein
MQRVHPMEGTDVHKQSKELQEEVDTRLKMHGEQRALILSSKDPTGLLMRDRGAHSIGSTAYLAFSKRL